MWRVESSRGAIYSVLVGSMLASMKRQVTVLARLALVMGLPAMVAPYAQPVMFMRLENEEAVVCCLPIGVMVSSLVLHLPSLWSPSLLPVARIGFLERLVYYSGAQTGVLYVLQRVLLAGLPAQRIDLVLLTSLYMVTDLVVRSLAWADCSNTLAPRMLSASMVTNLLCCVVCYGGVCNPMLTDTSWSQSLATHLVALCIAEFGHELYYWVGTAIAAWCQRSGSSSSVLAVGVGLS